MEDFTTTALKEMFKRVGQEYSLDFCEDDGWYQAYTWTECQEKAFRRYLARQFRREMPYLKMYKPEYRRRKLYYNVGMFLLNYGWKTR